MSDRPIDPDTGELQVRPFADWLREQSGGASHDELSDALHELVSRVGETGRKGTLIYTIQIDPRGAGGALTVTDQIKVKLPEFDRTGSLFWPDKDGNLRRSDPNQLSFDTLREVPTTPVRDAPGNQEGKQA